MPTIIMSPLAGGLGPFTFEDLATIRRRTGLLIGELTYGPVTSGTTTTFVMDALKRYPDDYTKAVGGTAYIVSGTGAGQARVVSGTTQATGTGTVALAFSPAPDSTSVIEIWPALRTPEDVNNAINLAVLDAQELVWVPDRANPTAIDTTYYRELSLPSSFIAVYGFRYRDASGLYRTYRMTGEPEDLPQSSGLRSVALAGSLLIIRPELSASTALADMWVLGYRRPALLVNDTDRSDVRTDFLVYKAATLLEETKAGGGDIDPEDHAGRAANWLREALDIRQRLTTDLEPNTQEITP